MNDQPAPIRPNPAAKHRARQGTSAPELREALRKQREAEEAAAEDDTPAPLVTLHYHVTGAIARGEAFPIVEQRTA